MLDWQEHDNRKLVLLDPDEVPSLLKQIMGSLLRILAGGDQRGLLPCCSATTAAVFAAFSFLSNVHLFGRPRDDRPASSPKLAVKVFASPPEPPARSISRWGRNPAVIKEGKCPRTPRQEKG